MCIKNLNSCGSVLDSKKTDIDQHCEKDQGVFTGVENLVMKLWYITLLKCGDGGKKILIGNCDRKNKSQWFVIDLIESKIKVRFRETLSEYIKSKNNGKSIGFKKLPEAGLPYVEKSEEYTLDLRSEERGPDELNCIKMRRETDRLEKKISDFFTSKVNLKQNRNKVYSLGSTSLQQEMLKIIFLLTEASKKQLIIEKLNNEGEVSAHIFDLVCDGQGVDVKKTLDKYEQEGELENSRILDGGICYKSKSDAYQVRISEVDKDCKYLQECASNFFVPKSRMSKEIGLSMKNWCVTLTKDFGSHHARLMIEGLSATGSPWAAFIHFVGGSLGKASKKQLYGFGDSGYVDMKDLTRKDIVFAARSETWHVCSKDVVEAINSVKMYAKRIFYPYETFGNREKINDIVVGRNFFIFGGSSSLAQYPFMDEGHSCITLALQLLRIMNVSFGGVGSDCQGVVIINKELYTTTDTFVRTRSGKENEQKTDENFHVDMKYERSISKPAVLNKESSRSLLDVCYNVVNGNWDTMMIDDSGLNSEEFYGGIYLSLDLSQYINNSQLYTFYVYSPISIGIIARGLVFLQELCEKSGEVSLTRQVHFDPIQARRGKRVSPALHLKCSTNTFSSSLIFYTYSPLLVACLIGDDESVDFLLEKSVDVNNPVYVVEKPAIGFKSKIELKTIFNIFSDHPELISNHLLKRLKDKDARLEFENTDSNLFNETPTLRRKSNTEWKDIFNKKTFF